VRETETDKPPRTDLLRALGRWSLVALTLNSVIGSGIFGLPSVVADLLGSASVFAVPLAAVMIALILACYAEVAAQFSQSGGTYLYVRAAFGRFAGIQVGWFISLTRITAAAASANLFVIYLGQFWTRATLPFPRVVILSLVIGGLATVNCRGVRGAAHLGSGLAVAKLLALGLVCVAGATYLLAHHALAVVQVTHASNSWLKALLVLFFAYGGFEAALNPMGEARNPRHDAPFALFATLATVAIFYTAIQWVVVGILPDAAHSAKPLADVAQVVVGRTGALLISIGALASVYGFLSAQMLTGPRAFLAMAENADLPGALGAIHPEFRTPQLSIAIFALLTWLLALAGSFAWNVTLSAVARLFYYGLICAAVPVLRAKRPSDIRHFRVPLAAVFPSVGILICGLLFTAVDLNELSILAATFLLATLNWLAVAR